MLLAPGCLIIHFFERLWTTVKRTVAEWLEQGVFHWGAALAYYALFSLTPLLLLGLTAGGSLLGREAVRGPVLEQAGILLGPSAREVIREVLDQISLLTFDSFIVVPTVLLLLLGATAVFVNIQGALNEIWRLQPQSGLVRNLVRSRAMSVLMLVVLGGAVLLSALLSGLSQALVPYVPDAVAETLRLGRLVEGGVTFVILWLLLTSTFTILPDARIAWRDVWLGAGVTALLLYLGQALMGLYLGKADLGSAFGAAGSLFTLLVWIYYSAQIFFLGAVFTRVWADLHGASVQPEDYAARVETRTVPRNGRRAADGVGERA